jgi:hypothetical protein
MIRRLRVPLVIFSRNLHEDRFPTLNRSHVEQYVFFLAALMARPESEKSVCHPPTEITTLWNLHIHMGQKYDKDMDELTDLAQDWLPTKRPVFPISMTRQADTMLRAIRVFKAAFGKHPRTGSIWGTWLEMTPLMRSDMPIYTRVIIHLESGALTCIRCCPADTIQTVRRLVAFKTKLDVDLIQLFARDGRDAGTHLSIPHNRDVSIDQFDFGRSLDAKVSLPVPCTPMSNIRSIPEKTDLMSVFKNDLVDRLFNSLVNVPVPDASPDRSTISAYADLFVAVIEAHVPMAPLPSHLRGVWMRHVLLNDHYSRDALIASEIMGMTTWVPHYTSQLPASRSDGKAMASRFELVSKGLDDLDPEKWVLFETAFTAVGDGSHDTVVVVFTHGDDPLFTRMCVRTTSSVQSLCELIKFSMGINVILGHDDDQTVADLTMAAMDFEGVLCFDIAKITADNILLQAVCEVKDLEDVGHISLSGDEKVTSLANLIGTRAGVRVMALEWEIGGSWRRQDEKDDDRTLLDASVLDTVYVTECEPVRRTFVLEDGDEKMVELGATFSLTDTVQDVETMLLYRVGPGARLVTMAPRIMLLKDMRSNRFQYLS